MNFPPESLKKWDDLSQCAVHRAVLGKDAMLPAHPEKKI